jgi:hypothetical protein
MPNYTAYLRNVLPDAGEQRLLGSFYSLQVESPFVPGYSDYAHFQPLWPKTQLGRAAAAALHYSVGRSIQLKVESQTNFVQLLVPASQIEIARFGHPYFIKIGWETILQYFKIINLAPPYTGPLPAILDIKAMIPCGNRGSMATGS